MGAPGDPFLRTRIKRNPSSIFNSFAEQKIETHLVCLVGWLVVCIIWSAALQTVDDGDPPLCLESVRAETKARSTPGVIFHPDTKQVCCRGFLLTLYGSVGVLSWQPSRALGLLLSSGRVSPATGTVNTPPSKRFFPYCRFFFFSASCETYIISSKITRVSVGVKTFLSNL